LKKYLKSSVKFLFFLGIGVLLIWLAVRNLTEEDKTTIAHAFSKTDYFWIILSTILSGVSHLLRAMRWKLLLQPLGFNPKLHNTFFALMVGYMANLALPRVGEVSRCGILTKYEKIPFTESFGTVIAERAIDLLCLLILFIVALVFQFDILWSLTNEKIISPLGSKLNSLMQNSLFMWGAALFIVLLVVAIRFIMKKSNGGLLKKIKDILVGFLEGLKSVKNIKRPYVFILETVLIWFFYAYVLYIAFFCFAETSNLGFGAALATMLFGSLGIAFVPGGTGAYQALVTETLTIAYKAPFAFAFAFAWLIWSTQFIFILLVGVISLILLPILNKDVVEEK
jgi:uncharacterized protein (TIRG00374 family)